MIADMTFSDTPACFSAISASVRVSNFVWLERIFARMTFSENPALTIWMTVSLVMTSWPETDAVEPTSRQAASRREVKSPCVLKALRRATSKAIWKHDMEEIQHFAGVHREAGAVESRRRIEDGPQSQSVSFCSQAPARALGVPVTELLE